MKGILYILFLSVTILAMPIRLRAETVTDQASADAFSNTWITNNDYSVDIWNDTGTFDLIAVHFETDDEIYSITFESCVYDEDTKTLHCENGLLLYESGNEVDGNYIAETLAAGFQADLFVDKGMQLHWTGSGEIMPDQICPLKEEEDDGMFVGEWECGNTWIDIEKYGNTYDVFVMLDVGEVKSYYWEYTCTCDSQTNTLKGTGSKYMEVHAEEEQEDVKSVRGNVDHEADIYGFYSELEYSDASALITLEEGNQLRWIEEKEPVGEAFLFSRRENQEEME